MKINYKNYFFGFLSLFLSLMSYFLLTHFSLINTNIFVEVNYILIVYIKWFNSGKLLIDIFDSIFRVICGFLIGLFLGVLFAFIFSLNKFIYLLFNPIIEFLRYVSPLAWVPFAILFFKIGNGSAIFLVSIASFFPIFTNTYQGIKNIKKSNLEIAIIFNLSFFQILYKVYLPSIMPYIFSAMKISIGISWYVLVASEMLGSQSGLGYMIQANKLSLQMEYVIASIIIIGFIGLLLRKIIDILEEIIIKNGKK